MAGASTRKISVEIYPCSKKICAEKEFGFQYYVFSIFKKTAIIVAGKKTDGGIIFVDNNHSYDFWFMADNC